MTAERGKRYVITYFTPNPDPAHGDEMQEYRGLQKALDAYADIITNGLLTNVKLYEWDKSAGRDGKWREVKRKLRLTMRFRTKRKAKRHAQ